jgi:uncharacterized RmlC-like cupin family protein
MNTTDKTNTDAPMNPAAAKALALVIAPEAFSELPGPPNAPFVRRQCYDDGHVWIGVATTEPGTVSPWHHHGEYDTYGYLLEGEARAEFVDPDRETVDCKIPGSFIFLPKGVAHREMNPGTTRNRILIMRVGHGQSIFPVDAPAQS